MKKKVIGKTTKTHSKKEGVKMRSIAKGVNLEVVLPNDESASVSEHLAPKVEEKITENEYRLNIPETAIDEDVKAFEKSFFENKSIKSKKKLVVSTAIIMIIITVFSVSFFKTNNNEKIANNIIADVGSIIVLPEGEPAIAVVEKPEELAKNDSFYKEASIGDYVIVYKDRAILYDPKFKKIKFAIPLTQE